MRQRKHNLRHRPPPLWPFFNLELAAELGCNQIAHQAQAQVGALLRIEALWQARAVVADADIDHGPRILHRVLWLLAYATQPGTDAQRPLIPPREPMQYRV